MVFKLLFSAASRTLPETSCYEDLGLVLRVRGCRKGVFHAPLPEGEQTKPLSELRREEVRTPLELTVSGCAEI